MTTNNMNIYNIPIVIDNDKFNITIAINKIQTLKTNTVKLEDKQINNYESIKNDLIDNLNGKYRDNLELIKEKIDVINDKLQREKVISSLYDRLCECYENEGKNGDILLYFARLIKEYGIGYTNCICYGSVYEYLLSQQRYKTMKYLLDKGFYEYGEYYDLFFIMNIPNINNTFSVIDTLNFKTEALLKYDINNYKKKYSFDYDALIHSYDKIKNIMIFNDINVLNSNGVSNFMDNFYGNNVYKLLDKVCENGLMEIALRVLEDEEKNNGNLEEAQYMSEYALEKALENNMVEVVFKMVSMRKKKE